MLSGQAPFYSRPRVDTASSIMRRIKEGDFRLDGEVRVVVETATLTKLLTGICTYVYFFVKYVCNVYPEIPSLFYGQLYIDGVEF